MRKDGWMDRRVNERALRVKSSMNGRLIILFRDYFEGLKETDEEERELPRHILYMSCLTRVALRGFKES